MPFEEGEEEAKPAKESMFSFLHCLKVFQPTQQPDGKGKFYGLALLGTGCFMAVLATAYVVSTEEGGPKG